MTVFIDANIVVYSVDTAASPKTSLSAQWLHTLSSREALVINQQVLR